MIEATTRRPLDVCTDGGAGPYIVLPVTQLDLVTALLDANGVSYWVDEEAVSLDGNPEVAVINLARGSDVETLKRLLNGIP